MLFGEKGCFSQSVLLGKTKGYPHHPQLLRFTADPKPIKMISLYLRYVHTEATQRGYHFNESKITQPLDKISHRIKIPRGQIRYEFMYLMKKIKKRDPKRWR